MELITLDRSGKPVAYGLAGGPFEGFALTESDPKEGRRRASFQIASLERQRRAYQQLVKDEIEARLASADKK